MANLDTANKRGAAIGIAHPSRLVMPIADGALVQADRQQTAYAYPGILAGAQAIPTVLDDLTTVYCRWAWDTIKDANPTKVDVATLLRDNHATVVAGGNSPDDINTAYAYYLSVLY